MAHQPPTKGPAGGDVLFSQLLRGPYDAFLEKLYAGLAEAGFADTSPSWGHNVFFYLRGGGLRLTELAERAHATKQAMLYTVNQLEAAGYVERASDPTDARAKIVRLTQRGWEVRRVADELMVGIREECVRRLGERRMRQFEELMKDVSEAIAENREQG